MRLVYQVIDQRVVIKVLAVDIRDKARPMTRQRGGGNPLATVLKEQQRTSSITLRAWYVTGVRHLFNYCARNFVIPN